MLAIFKREFKSFFQTVIGWLFLAVTLCLFGLYFYVYNLAYGLPYLSNTLSAITFIFLITVPLLTMRILAEERKNKTDQLILTAPVSVGKIVLGKYLAMAAVCSIAAAVICVTPLVLSMFGDIPYGECYVAILGYWLFGLTCIAIGTFISSITESQVIAAVLTFGALFLGYMMSGITSLISSTGNLLTKVLNCYNLAAGMDNFYGGFLDVGAMIYYVSLSAFFLFLTVQAIQKRRWSMSSKKIRTGVFSTGFIAVALGVVVVVNLIGANLPDTVRSVDMTSQKLYSITDATKQVLDALDEDITIYVLANEENQDTSLQKTLERYRDYSGHINIVYKDPAVSPSFYTNYTDASVTKNSLIVEGAKRSKVINYSDIYETEVDYTTYQSSVTGYDAEGQLTSALTYVTRETTSVVYQLTGHDEQALSGSFSDAVSKLNADLQSLNLLETEEIPENASGLIINAPVKDFSKEDVTKVQNYLNGGGKAIIVAGYGENELPNFESLLAAYEVTLVDGVVMEADTSAYTQRPYYLLPKASYDASVGDASGEYVFLATALGLQYPKTGEDSGAENTEASETSESAQASDTSYTELLSSSDSAYSKVDIANTDTFDKEEGDIDGPFALGLHVSKKLSAEQTADPTDKEDTDDLTDTNRLEDTGTPDNAEEKEETTDLYLFGSSSIFTDEASQMVYGNNAALFTGILSQFVDSSVDSVVPVKSYEMSQLVINQAGIILSGLAAAILVPLALLILGIVIWARRRRK